jgi:hypothetical protein
MSPSIRIGRPDASEYAEYFGKYVSLPADGDIVATLEQQTAATLRELRAVTEEKSLYRYAEGKWSLREAWLHVADTERIFTYRLLRFARKDPANLSSFDQDIYIEPSKADERTWASIVDEFEAVRNATLHLVRNLPSDAWMRTGTVGGNTVSVRAMAYITAGHELHHAELMRKRYLGQ